MVPFTVKLLRRLSNTDYVPEYDVGGVNDPFLQTKLLRLIRMLGPIYIVRGEAKIAGVMKDTLAQVATNTESTRNVGNAVLYECVQSIIALGSDSSLLVLATNLLGRFLKHKDNNIRYVALNTMQTVLTVSESGMSAVQRHMQTIVDCLRDPDISIRRRALDLVYALVGPSNVRQLTRELLSYLVIADKEFRENIVAKLCWLIERYAPSPRWQFDTTIRVISLAASSAIVPDDVPASICSIVSQTPQLQAYAVQRLYAALVKEIAHPDLAKIGLWCMGEFGDLLIGTPAKVVADDDDGGDDDSGDDGDNDHSIASPSQVVDLIESILVYPYNRSKNTIREYGISTLSKLCVRFGNGVNGGSEACDRIKKILAKYSKDINVEIQQRSVEFLNIEKLNNVSIKNDVYDRMPPIENGELVEGDDAIGTSPVDSSSSTSTTTSSSSTTSSSTNVSASTNILDQIMNVSTDNTPKSTSSSGGNAVDLLADIFGGSGNTNANVNVNPTNPVNDLMSTNNDLLSVNSTIPPASQQSSLIDLIPSSSSSSMPAPAASVPSQPSLLSMPTSTSTSSSSSANNVNTGINGNGQDDGKIVPVYDKNGINVVMRAKNPKGDISLTHVVTTFRSMNVGCDVSDLLMRVAVPKWLKLELEPADGSVLKGGDSESKVTQVLKLINNSDGAKPTLIRVKITFKTGSDSVDEMVEVHL